MIENIRKRISCRSFRAEAIDAETIDALEGFLGEASRAPFGGRVRFVLLDLEKMGPAEVRACGTYGVIRGARWFIAGAVARRERAMEDYGYCLEKVILHATGLGLGTCWLGGTFNRTGFAARIGLAGDEILPAVTPIGFPRERRSIVDRVFRLGAGSNRRKSWDELFLTEDLGPLGTDRAGPYGTVLECVRLGPSASNKQPWRIVKAIGPRVGRTIEQKITQAGEPPCFHFFLQRTPGYGDLDEVRLQNIDMGIAMCHFEAAARELGLDGGWRIADPRPAAKGMEYIVSWSG